jgi:serine/threonine-protein kinase
LSGTAAARRFQKEATTASALNHPHIVTVHEAGEIDGLQLLVTEFVDGGTLAAWATGGKRSWQQIVGLLVGVADGLAAAHDAGILHRDIKPHNILVTTSGYAKLADFGLATMTQPASSDSITRSAVQVQTSPGAIIGTLPYMSPEQARGATLDARSDVFSFGVVLYELLSGRRPFEGPSDIELLHAITSDSPRPLPADLPVPMRMLVEKALEKDPAHRYQSMRELVVDLRALTRHSEQRALPVAERPPRRLAWVAAAIVVVTGIVGLAWFGGRMRDAAPAAPDIRTLAVLPLKPLVAGSDEHLALGVPDTIIARIGQIEGVIVRPLSAVRRYSAVDSDPVKAASELNVDAVLDGSFQRSGDRLRVNMTLLRAGDGAALWSRTFNANLADIFAIEDEISQQVVSQLRLRLSPDQQLRLTKHSTTRPEAYEYYLKGVRTFGTVGGASPNVVGDVAVGLKMLDEAVRLDPDYALAHAQRAWGYTWMGLFSNNGGQAWIDRAQEALAVAERLDSGLAETHVVRFLLLYSSYNGYQIVPAFEELRTAQRLNPNVGHWEMADLLSHVGLVDPALNEARRALEIDPTNQTYQSQAPLTYWMNAMHEEAIAANLKLPTGVPWIYRAYLGARRIADAQRLIDEALARNPKEPAALAMRPLRLALEGRFDEAEALLTPLPAAARMARNFHHAAYSRACVYALGGKADTAAEWLRETVRAGMPVYPAFERDSCFARIRQTPPFITFMADLKPVWDEYRRAMRPVTDAGAGSRP